MTVRRTRSAGKAAAGLLLAILVLLGAAGWYFSGLVIKPAVKPFETTYQLEIENKRFTPEYWDALPKQEVWIPSPQGYRLHAYYIPAAIPSKKTVVFVHGQTYSLYGSVKYVEIFRRLGYNCLLPDNRYHGKSGGKNSTFGYFERHDLRAIVDWVRDTTKGGSVGFHGESLGSAICLMHAAIDDRASFYILDGALADLTELLQFRLKSDFHLPSFPLVPAASIVSRLRGGMFFSSISPIRDIGQIRSPLFFIHGGADEQIPVENAERLYNAFQGRKRLWICPGAGHSKSVLVNRPEYVRQVSEFLAEIEKRQDGPNESHSQAR